MSCFAELDGEQRMFIRTEIEQLGASIAAYQGTGLLVALPNTDKKHLIHAIMDNHGYPLKQSHYFPLGTDKPPDTLRHHCPGYPKQDQPGWWYFAYYAAKKED